MIIIIIDLAREWRRLWNIIPIVISALGTVTKGLVRGLEDLKIRRRSGDHPNYNITKIGLNTKKSPGDFRGLALT